MNLLKSYDRISTCLREYRNSSLTINSISGIALIFVFDKSEASHKLDFGNLARASSRREMVLDVRLGGYNRDPWSVTEAALSTSNSTREERSIDRVV